MNTMTRYVLAALAASALAPAIASAQNSRNQGYLTDINGNVVMTASGLCIRDSDWTPARSAEPCPTAIKPLAAAPVPQPRPVVAAAPAPAPYVAPAPAPRPRAAVIAPIPPKMSFSADALFAFDKSDLKPEGKAMLDDLVRQLNGVTYESIHAIGHTDRIGSTAYNQKLSERRANTVKEYLVSRNIAANRITSEGKGEAEPMTRAGECSGAKSAKVVACLQPDRRVDVDMNGTKSVISTR